MDNIMFIIFIVGITFILYYFCALFWGSLQDIKKEKEKEKEDKKRQNENLEQSTNEIYEEFKKSTSACKNCKHVKFVKFNKETNTFEFYMDCSYPEDEKLPIYCQDFKERKN